MRIGPLVSPDRPMGALWQVLDSHASLFFIGLGLLHITGLLEHHHNGLMRLV